MWHHPVSLRLKPCLLPQFSLAYSSRVSLWLDRAWVWAQKAAANAALSPSRAPPQRESCRISFVPKGWQEGGIWVSPLPVQGCFPTSKPSKLETHFPLQKLSAPQGIHNSCAALQQCQSTPMLEHPQPGPLLSSPVFLRETYSYCRRSTLQRNQAVPQMNCF